MFLQRLMRTFRLLRRPVPETHWYLYHERLVNMTPRQLSSVSGIPWTRKACSEAVFRHVVLNEAKALRIRNGMQRPDSESTL